MFAGKPIIGIAGGIGSGKSMIADFFGELRCLVIHSDEQVKDAYRDPVVIAALRDWWGDAAFGSDGKVNRKAIASLIFNDPSQRQRLEKLLHPMVLRARDGLMQKAAGDGQVPAFVWDTPLLFEAGLHEKCDTVVFVQAPQGMRLMRVKKSRGWNDEELKRRENLQWPLDKKREISEYVIDNTADADYARSQVRDVLSRILARYTESKVAQPGG